MALSTEAGSAVWALADSGSVGFTGTGSAAEAGFSLSADSTVGTVAVFSAGAFIVSGFVDMTSGFVLLSGGTGATVSVFAAGAACVAVSGFPASADVFGMLSGFVAAGAGFGAAGLAGAVSVIFRGGKLVSCIASVGHTLTHFRHRRHLV